MWTALNSAVIGGIQTKLGYSVTLLALVLLFIGLLSNCALATPVFVDTFDDGILDPGYWSTIIDGTGPSIAETNGRLELTIPATSTSSNDVLAAECRTTFLLRGDFDFQADYLLLDWPHIDSKCSLSTVFDGVERIYLNGDKYLMHHDPYHPISTTQMSGKMRLSRSNGLMTGYYYSGGLWTVIGQYTSFEDTPIRLSTWIYESTFQHQQIRVAFDNLTINSGTIIPVPEPSSLLALGGIIRKKHG